MEEKDYCKLVFLGLINLLSFLFSIVFLISSYNIKSKEEIEGIKYTCSYEAENLIDNHYKGNLALFVLQVFCFAFFFIFSMGYFYFNEKDENEARLIRYQAITLVIQPLGSKFWICIQPIRTLLCNFFCAEYNRRGSIMQ